MLADGRAFGDDQPLILHLLEVPQAEKALAGMLLFLQRLGSELEFCVRVRIKVRIRIRMRDRVGVRGRFSSGLGESWMVSPCFLSLGVVMELSDAAYPLLTNVVPTSDPAIGFKDVDYAILVGAFPRKQVHSSQASS